MAEALKIVDEPTDVLALVEADPTPFLVDRDKRRDFMDQVRQVALTAGDDVTTAKSRAAIIATAAKVTKCKTTIDNAGKAMTEEWREKTAAVNEARREVRDEFALLAAQVRKPVTDWEEAEKARQERVTKTLTELRGLVANPAPFGATAQVIQERIDEVSAEEIDPAVFGDDTEFAMSVKAEALTALKGALATVQKAEAEQAELARLRQAEAEREERERAEREAAEAKAREEAEAKARAEREAEEAKRREEEQKRAAEEAERLAEQRAAEAAEKAREEERARIEAEQRAQREAEEKERAAAERKAANAKHRSRIRAEVAEVLETRFELDGARANAIAAAIEAGEIPHTSIQF